MSNEKYLFWFCQYVNKMALKELLNIHIDESLNTDSIGPIYYKMLIKFYTKFFPRSYTPLTKLKASENIQEKKPKTLNNSFKKFDELYSFYLLKDLNNDILQYSHKKKKLSYIKYLCPFIEIIIRNYIDDKIFSSLLECATFVDNYNKETLIIKKVKNEKLLSLKLDKYNFNISMPDNLAANIRYEIYFCLSMFKLYFKELKNIKTEKEICDEISNIFIGKMPGNNDLIKELNKDNNIFNGAQEWFNSFKLLEKQDNIDIIN